MTIINEKFIVHTKGNTEIKDITRQVQNAVYKHSLHDAVVQSSPVAVLKPPLSAVLA